MKIPAVKLACSLVLVALGSACASSSDSGDTFKSNDGQGGSGQGGDAAGHLIPCEHHHHHPCGSTSHSSSSSSAAAGGGAASSASSASGTSSSNGASSTSGSGAGSSSSSSGAGGGAISGGLFEANEPWNQRVDSDPKAASSDAIIAALSNAGGWGTGAMKIDFSITLQYATPSTPFENFTPTPDFYSPDCDHVPFPLPAGGAIEGEQGYACTNDGDCHLLVVDPAGKKLYEMWRAFTGGSGFTGGCAAVWDLTKAYPANLRGDGCTSADAGGFPVGAMLFTADEIAAGEIPHAIRFILPNSRIRGGDVYVHPGTHTTGSTSGGANAPPYGVRLRLKSSFDTSSLPSNGARVVAKAMQTYGMFLADGGNIALTAADDRFTTAKWTDVGVSASSLTGLDVSDFEVVDLDATVALHDCVRNP